MNLISLRAGEEAGEGAAAGRQRGCERGAAVSQDGLQVAEGKAWVKDILHRKQALRQVIRHNKRNKVWIMKSSIQIMSFLFKAKELNNQNKSILK